MNAIWLARDAASPLYQKGNPMGISGEGRSEPQLLRVPYQSKATGDGREFLLYLPIGYESDSAYRWPVILFMHGGGERGNGKEDLDYVLLNGPLGEAWLQGHDLPFVMIGPQLPVFDMVWQVQLRANVPKPQRLERGPQPRRPTARPTQPMVRAADLSPVDVPGLTEAWGDQGFPGGWQLYEEDLLAMVDHVLRDYQTDADRVYVTGLSYGGHGTWHLGMTHPERWAAIAPICGDANPQAVGKMAERQLPVWIFQGGRDLRIKPQWIFDVANALEAAGHPEVRFTVHEDLPHDCWTRVYAGQDLYDWFLEHTRS
jgi:predicted peptidase